MTYQIGIINMHERVGSQAPQAFDYFYAIGCPIAIFVKYFVSYWEYIHLIQVISDSIKSVLRNIIYGIDSILGILIFFLLHLHFKSLTLRQILSIIKIRKAKFRALKLWSWMFAQKWIFDNQIGMKFVLFLLGSSLLLWFQIFVWHFLNFRFVNIVKSSF